MAIHSLASGAGLNQLENQARTFYQRVFVRELNPRLLYNRFGMADTIPLREGRTISWPTMDPLEAGEALPEGGDGTEGDVTLGNITASLADYGKYHRYSNHVDLSAPDPVLTTLVRRLAVRAAKDIDAATRDVLAAVSNIIRPNDRAADVNVVAGDILDQESIQQAVSSFDENDVDPITGFLSANAGSSTVPGEPSFVAIVHAHTVKDLRENAPGNGFQSVDTYATGNNTLPGEVGKMDQVRFISAGSAGKVEANIGASSTVDVYTTVVMGADAYGVIDLAGRGVNVWAVAPTQLSHGNPLARRGSIGYTTEHAAAVLQSAGVIAIRHSSSKGTNV